MFALLRLQAALLPLLASFHTGHCHFQCPLECVGTFAVPTDRGVRVIGGPAAKKVGKIIKDLTETRPSSPHDEITIDGEKVPVPSKVKSQMRNVLNNFPELSTIFLDILRKPGPKSLPHGKQRFSSPDLQEEAVTPGSNLQQTTVLDAPLSRLPDQFRPSQPRPFTKPVGPDTMGPLVPGQRKPQNSPQASGSPEFFFPKPFNSETSRPSNDQPSMPEGPLDSENSGAKRSKPQFVGQPEEQIPSDTESSESVEFEPTSPTEKLPRSKKTEPILNGAQKPSLPETSDQSSPEESLPSGPQNDFPSNSKKFKPHGTSGPGESIPGDNESFSPSESGPQNDFPFSSKTLKPDSSSEFGESIPGDNEPFSQSESGPQNDFPFSSKTSKPDSSSEPEEGIPGDNKPFSSSESEKPSNPDNFSPEGSSEPSSSGGFNPPFSKANLFPSHPARSPDSKFSKPSGFLPSSQSERRPDRPINELPTPEANEKTPEVSVPDHVKVPSKDERVPGDVRSYLKYLEDNPSLFVPVYKILVNKGVRFPDLRRPLDHVTINGERVNLARPVTVAFPVRINYRTFTLPRDADKLATFASQHPEQLPAITTAIRQLGGTLTPDNRGRVSSFTLFDKKTELPHSVAPRIIVNGRPFTLPNDMEELVRTIEKRPQLFHNILPILETFGARPQRSPSGEIRSIEFRGRNFPVRSVTPVPVFIRGRRYNIPADLERILAQSDSQVVGELISALQRSKVPVVVDNETGNVVGIERDGVRIPFPVAIRFRIKLGGREYLIPRDLPSIVTQLERHGVPTDVLTVLYDNYGIIPVRGPNHDVTAIEFNGKRYPIKPQPKTSIEVGGHRLMLPRDNQKLVRLIQERKIPLNQFLRTIQNSGYRLVPGPDGVLQTAHKGYDVIKLPVGIRMLFRINGVTYRIPQDLPRIVKLLRTVRNEAAIDKILDNLKAFGVDVRKGPGQATLSFNGEKQTFPLNPERTFHSPGTGGIPGSVVSVNFNGRWYHLPKDAKDLVRVVRASGPEVIALLVKTLQSNGVKVNLTPSGDDIVSFVIQGRVIPVPSNGGKITDQKKAPTSYAQGSGDDSSNRFRVAIRGHQFVVPDDVGRLPKLLPGFQYGELITALHRAGHKMKVDDQGMFYGMRVRGGRLVKFPIRFSVSVFADRKGRPYRVPKELEQLARVLPLRRWNWNAVRKTLENAGIEVSGGNGGAPQFISFEGRVFKVGKSHDGAGY
ncbi:uncharacterized protein [Dermacentor albipictus]|uniref:uncharacterized protein n=1 Tax=Dermacentor albipictus TaxID=60249 RepID=UPI0031FBDAC7